MHIHELFSEQELLRRESLKQLKALGISVKDGKNGAEWTIG